MKKRAITLIEIMIVILLISLIGGVIGYNVKGSLKKGRNFKTNLAKTQLEDVLEICLQEGGDPAQILKNTAEALRDSGLVKDPDALLKDGDGRRFDISYDSNKKVFIVR